MTVSGSAAAGASGANATFRILVARGLRAFGDGFVALLVPIYLLELGFSAGDIGALRSSGALGKMKELPK